jgi:hypothetical protein
VHLQGPISDVVVRNNVAVDHTVAGYAVGEAENLAIYGNEGRGNAMFGLLVEGGVMSTACVAANDFEGAIQSDIELDTCSGVPGSTPAVVTAALPDAHVGEPFELVLVAEGGAAPHSWAAVAGTVPFGLAASADGTLAGTPTRAGLYTSTLYAYDARAPAQSARAVLDLIVLP